MHAINLIIKPDFFSSWPSASHRLQLDNAGHYDPFWDELFKEINKSYLSISTHVCNPSLNERFYREGISDVSIRDKAFKQCMLNRNHLKVLMDAGKVENLILAGSWNHYYASEPKIIDDLEEVSLYAAEIGINVFIMASPVMYTKNITSLFESCILNNNCVPYDEFRFDYDYNHEVLDIIKNFSKLNDGITFIEREDIFNSDDSYEFYGFRAPYSLDGGHISTRASKEAFLKFRTSEKYN
ncbi:SGNH hydrolase domain-containing protein [Moritella viscosa]|uniref:SGNH hydrolase domain-containing protein n=1 Tax=Moritella viscosa TaxID=80854 RepID=UPI0020C89BE9|nr:SGNH hydrolase domain-containing protein [Moritella viscosa]